MAMSRIALATTIDPESVTGTTSSGGTFSQNAMFEQDVSGKTFVTQRPAINILADASEESASNKGRGVYYWAKEATLVIINDDEVWTGEYNTQIGSISAGAGQVWIGELGDYLVILDHLNGEGWTINSSLVLSQISDGDFPATLAGGGAVLDKTLYVLDRDGVVYGSDLNDPTSWNALNFTEAEREPDNGVYIAKYLDHVVVFGSKTIEFFYNAANPTGSPLSRRQDISYRKGALNRQSVWREGDDLYFISADRSGSVSLSRLRQFQVEEVSTVQIEKYLESNFRLGDVELVLYGAHVFGHVFIFLTLANFSSGAYTPKETLVYDVATNFWTSFNTTLKGNVYFPVISWTDRQPDSIEFSFGLFTSGDLIRFSGGTVAVDSVAESAYVQSGYIESQDDYIQQGAGMDLTPYRLIIRTPEFDGANESPVAGNNKFMHKIDLVGDFSKSSEVSAASLNLVTDPIYIKWSDDHYRTWSDPVPIILDSKQRVTRLGRFLRRGFELDTETTYRVRLYYIDVYYGVSTYA